MHDAFEIAGWQVQPRLNRMAGATGEVTLEPRMMRVLVYLAQRPGEVVRREELLDTVWAGAVVTENSLTNSISALRKLLGDDPRHPRIIETIRGVGYRLVAPVVRLPAPLPFQYGDGLPAGVAPAGPKTPARLYVPWLWGLGLVLLGAVGYFGWTASAPPPLRIQPLTALPGPELHPAFSPDGRQVAFARFGAQGADLYVQTVGGETPTQLTTLPGAELSPAWTPDGARITFFSYAPTGCGLFSIPAAGGTPALLMETTCSVSGLSWSSDGQWLAFSEAAPATGPRRIFLMAARTQTPTPITDPPATSVGDFAPVFAPDGRTLLFARSLVGGASDLYTRPATTAPAPPVRLTHDAVPLTGYDWTRNGQEVVFASHRAQTRGVWRMPATGGRPRLVRPVAVEDPGSVVLSRATPAMAYVAWTYQVNIVQQTVEAGTTVPFAASTRTDAYPSYAPQGDRVAFVSARTGNAEIWVQTLTDEEPVRLTHLKTTQMGRPTWSPDGRWLAFAADAGEGTWAVYVIAAEGGPPRAITQTAHNDIAPSWSADGQLLYFGSDRSGAWQIWQQSVIAGPAVQVTRDGGYRALAGPEGRMLFYTKPRQQGLWAKDLATGAETHQVPQADPYLWAVTARGLYYVTQQYVGAPFELHRQTGQTGQTPADPVPVASWAPHPNAPFARWGLSVAPDESAVLYGTIDQHESDVMLVTPFQ